jgi:hypothetical protein
MGLSWQQGPLDSVLRFANLSEREPSLGMYRRHAHADKKIPGERVSRPRQSGATWLDYYQ